MEKTGGGYGQQQVKIILRLCFVLWEGPRASSTFCFSFLIEQFFATHVLVSLLQGDIYKHLCTCLHPNVVSASRAVPGLYQDHVAPCLAEQLALEKTAVTLHDKCLALTWHQGSNPQIPLPHLR